MPKNRIGEQECAFPPAVLLKMLALRDDPLVRDHRQLHAQLFSDKNPFYCPTSQPEKEMLNRLMKLDIQICKKYKLPRYNKRYPKVTFDPDWTIRAYEPAMIHNTVRVSTTWLSNVSDDPKNYLAEYIVGPSKAPFPQEPTSPVMTIKVDLSRVNPKQPGWLIEWFKGALHNAFKEIPNAYRKEASPWSKIVLRDYERYRLHQEGMPYRWIAFRERTGKDRMASTDGLSETESLESAISDSIEKVHLIVRGEKYSARKHKNSLREAPLKQLCDSYDCSSHGRDLCPIQCPNAKKLMKSADLLLK